MVSGPSCHTICALPDRISAYWRCATARSTGLSRAIMMEVSARIEDTDRARSTDEAIEAILDGMAWLGLNADDEPVFQHKNADRHIRLSKHYWRRETPINAIAHRKRLKPCARPRAPPENLRAMTAHGATAIPAKHPTGRLASLGSAHQKAVL